MKYRNYYLVSEKVIPTIYHKVLKAKELLATQKAKDVSEAVQIVGISRSVYYKYYHSIQLLTSSENGRKASINIKLAHKKGTLSKVLDCLSDSNVNILTIFQGLPIHTAASVQLMMDISEALLDIDEMMQKLLEIDAVIDVELQGIE